MSKKRFLYKHCKPITLSTNSLQDFLFRSPSTLSSTTFRLLRYQTKFTNQPHFQSHSQIPTLPFTGTTYLPLLQPAIPRALRTRRRPARHLRLMYFRVLLRQTCTNLLVHFEVALLTVFVAVGDCFAADALEETCRSGVTGGAFCEVVGCWCSR